MSGSPEVEILRRARAALLSAGFPTVSLRPLPSDVEGVVVRHVPTTVVTSYMDGSREVQVPFGVYCRFRGEDRAIDACSAAKAAIVIDGLSPDDGLYEVTEPPDEYASAQRVEEPRGDMFAYEVALRVTILTNF